MKRRQAIQVKPDSAFADNVEVTVNGASFQAKHEFFLDSDGAIRIDGKLEGFVYGDAVVVCLRGSMTKVV